MHAYCLILKGQVGTLGVSGVAKKTLDVDYLVPHH